MSTKKDKNEQENGAVAAKTEEPRWFDTIEEAEKHKPTDPKRANWELITLEGFEVGADGKAKPKKAFGWTGGAAVLGWQFAAACGFKAYKTHSGRAGRGSVTLADFHAKFASMSDEERAELIKQYAPDLLKGGTKPSHKGGSRGKKDHAEALSA